MNAISPPHPLHHLSGCFYGLRSMQIWKVEERDYQRLESVSVERWTFTAAVGQNRNQRSNYSCHFSLFIVHFFHYLIPKLINSTFPFIQNINYRGGNINLTSTLPIWLHIQSFPGSNPWMKGGKGVNQTLIVKDHNSLKITRQNWHKSCGNLFATYISLTFLIKRPESQIMKKKIKPQLRMSSGFFVCVLNPLLYVPNFT